ncbi:hypothetical protein WJX84_003511 [Apatococcus fuscideae]|uniref:TPM domain-containing protein n=1 Tax=Apatococcus fuscideae TaxID=2026836 RepID=A0AAW1RZR3_9CHLO
MITSGASGHRCWSVRESSRKSIARYLTQHSRCNKIRQSHVSCSSKPVDATTQPVWKRAAGGVAAAVLSASLLAGGVSARLEGVNKPELLPKEFTTVIDVAGFLTPGETKRIKREIEDLEGQTGMKLRVLAQNYPQTPGLAIKDFWGVDDDTVVFVADPSLGNILNFNVGSTIDLRIPRNFWTRLASKYGTKKYWQEKGQEASIVNAVGAIDTCAREPVGRTQCSKIQGEFGEEPSSGALGKAFFGS